MIIKRINTDLVIKLKVYNNKTVVDLNTVKSLVLYVHNRNTDTDIKQTIKLLTDTSYLQFQWNSEENKECGTFDVRIEYDIDNTDSEKEVKTTHYIVDFPELFKVVSKSTDEEGEGIAQMAGNAYCFNSDIPEYLTVN